MSNPKVFEFAKEIGMTPLALMDKIKEWQLPIKNHMAELSPDILSELKSKLSSGGSDETVAEEKPKKAAAKKTTKAATTKTAARTTKKAVATVDVDANASTVTVIRRKTKDVEPVETKAKIISKPVEDEPIIENEAVSEEEVIVKPEVKLNVKEASFVESKKVDTPVSVVAAESAPKVVAPTAAAPTQKEELAPAAAASVGAPAPTATVASQPVVSRKKEVAIGDSGVSSSTSVASRKNIIGRMDLSRVQAPPGATNTGGYQGRSSGGPGGGRPQGGGYQRPAGGGHSGGGFSGPRPAGGGFSGPRPVGAGTGNRNIRTGFVAQAMPEPVAPGF
ncbi:MAG: hypothetical protein ACK41T_12775, partial [Pseudobdellovibrio sp.]